MPANYSDEAVTSYIDELFSDVDDDTEISDEDRQRLESLLSKSTQGMSIGPHKHLIPLINLNQKNATVTSQVEALLELVLLLKKLPQGKLRINILEHCQRISEQLNQTSALRLDPSIQANIKDLQKEVRG